MSKWCGDENCLQCADKEPDPYVHLPRADYEALREQNRVLTEAFAKTTKGKVTINRYEHGGGRMFVDDGKNRDLIADTYNEGDREFIALCYEVFSKQAALTTTSQPTHEKDDRALVSKVDVLEQALEFAVRGLKAAQPIVCSMCCPSVKRTSEPWTHRQSCDSLTLTLRTVEAQLSNPAAESVQHLCGARGFGQSLDDRCPGCDATSQEGQHESR